MALGERKKLRAWIDANQPATPGAIDKKIAHLNEGVARLAQATAGVVRSANPAQSLAQLRRSPTARRIGAALFLLALCCTVIGMMLSQQRAAEVELAAVVADEQKAVAKASLYATAKKIQVTATRQFGTEDGKSVFDAMRQNPFERIV